MNNIENEKINEDVTQLLNEPKKEENFQQKLNNSFKSLEIKKTIKKQPKNKKKMNFQPVLNDISNDMNSCVNNKKFNNNIS